MRSQPFHSNKPDDASGAAPSICNQDRQKQLAYVHMLCIGGSSSQLVHRADLRGALAWASVGGTHRCTRSFRLSLPGTRGVWGQRASKRVNRRQKVRPVPACTHNAHACTLCLLPVPMRCMHTQKGVACPNRPLHSWDIDAEAEAGGGRPSEKRNEMLDPHMMHGTGWYIDPPRKASLSAKS